MDSQSDVEISEGEMLALLSEEEEKQPVQNQQMTLFLR